MNSGVHNYKMKIHWMKGSPFLHWWSGLIEWFIVQTHPVQTSQCMKPALSFYKGLVCMMKMPFVDVSFAMEYFKPIPLCIETTSDFV